MCGIFAYQWPKKTLPILQHWLQRLEYRGYDSAGVCVMTHDGENNIIKSVGKVSELEAKVLDTFKNGFPSSWEWQKLMSGIAHTRWATHGEATETNTHPHTDTKQEFFVVHNGIIENHVKLKKKLRLDGYEFYSQTDTEVVPALLSIYWTGNLLETVEKVLPTLHGAYALLIMTKNSPDEMVAVKWWSPLILWIGSGEYFFSSDIQALAGYAESTISLTDGELVHIKGGEYTIKAEWKIIRKTMEKLDIEAMNESKGDYDSFMRKEIDEQPTIIRRAFKGRVDFNTKSIHSDATEFLANKTIEKVVFIGCGTSYNAGQLWAHRINDIADIDAEAKIASEYMYQRHRVNNTTLYIFLSQSGETADSIEVLKYIKAKGWMTFGIVNVVGSTIANLTDCGYFLRAGYEIGVASTKAFTSQLVCILMLALYLGKKGSLSYENYTDIMNAMKTLPILMEQVLSQDGEISDIARILSSSRNMFFLGRKYQYVIADEWSLKLKELSYIHSESYPAGELKHGPLALIEDSLPSVLLAPWDSLFEQNMSTMAEVQSRKGKVLVIGDREAEWAEWQLRIPTAHTVVMPFLTTLSVQLLSYHVAKHLGRDIDKPRNLAKSVTVK